MAEQIIFYILALVIVVFSILAVSGKLVIRSATYLLFVLIATASYLLLNFHYLFAVQIAVYAGGIMVLFIMAIFQATMNQRMSWKVKCISCTCCQRSTHQRIHYYPECSKSIRLPERWRTEHAGPWTFDDGNWKNISICYHSKWSPVLLLACIVGAILIARKKRTIRRKC